MFEGGINVGFVFSNNSVCSHPSDPAGANRPHLTVRTPQLKAVWGIFDMETVSCQCLWNSQQVSVLRLVAKLATIPVRFRVSQEIAFQY